MEEKYASCVLNCYKPTRSIKITFMSIDWKVVVGLFAAIVALIGIKVQIRNASKLRENSEKDAYDECKRLIKNIKETSDCLFLFSPNTINGFNVSNYFSEKDKYHLNQKVKDDVRSKMTQAVDTANLILKLRCAIKDNLSKLDELGGVVPQKNKKLIIRFIDHMMQLEPCIHSYVNLVFDYFEDGEYCNNMRDSKHLMNDDINNQLLQFLEESQTDIYKITGYSKIIFNKINLNIPSLYKVK